MPLFRDRILELRRVPANQLQRNPKNWRLHPDGQRSAMAEMLASVGFVGALVGRDTAKGVELIDGEMRSDIAEDGKVPVVIVDLNDEEVEKVLATYDPLGGLSLIDGAKFDALLGGLSLDE